MLISVSISPFGMPKADRPLISYPVDLSLVIDDYMYVGFSAATGAISATHNVHGWSFRIGGRAQDLDPLKLPSLSNAGTEKVVQGKGFELGTLGYIAPELTRTVKATTSTDVYGFGILMLEAACGWRQLEPQKNAAELLLIDWVRELHSKEEITKAVDSTLDDYILHEVKLVLSLGLLCSHPHPNCRPNMRRIVQFLLGDADLPPLPLDIHLQIPRAMMEHWDVSPDDSDPSYSRMTTSKSNSSTSFDRKVTVNQGTGVTF
nr:putative l-type lectin-domain containing receptor kinase ii.2 [Quercus suber]